MNDLVILKPFGEVAELNRDELRDLISHIEKAALENGEKVEVPVHHHFSKGVYAREMVMPQGVLVVGKIHKHMNMNILSSGEASVLSIDGVKRVKAPYTFVASPGAKRVIFAHTDLVWTTIHGTDEKDLEKIEEEFIAKSYDDVVPLLEDVKKIEGEL